MFDIGWSEMMVIGVVALIVIGPKDLPVMFQALGRFTAKARAMAREFSRAMEDAAKASGVNDVAKDLKNITSPKSLGLDKVQQAVGKFEAWDPMKKSAPAVKGTAAKAAPAATPAAGTAPAAASPATAAAPTTAAVAATAAAAPAEVEAAPATPAAPPGPPPFDPLAGT